eukprot:TRINITY_DN11713_c0_g1_i1.p1 TRINITY_DN11713_c0_g1~~TRINITY_DN11713_c0_g1_i1.p1  ORF type:complete len:258 (+),score=51.73 TRINITY_DN11713_c0_g1_i1:39-776(+)
MDYPKHLISVALLTHDDYSYLAWRTMIEERFNDLQYQAVKLIHRPSSFKLTEGYKRTGSIQGQRRREIARQRNFLLSSALGDQEHVLWIDADMMYIPEKVLSKMVSSGKDIIATQTVESTWYFDRNTWVGPRTRPSADQLAQLERGEQINFVPSPAEGLKYLDEMEESGEEFVKIDSVGGTLLYVRANVHRDGAIFPAQFLIGATWKSEGYDGIETEGLCHIAERLGYTCWGMPKEKARHMWGCS